MRKDLVRPLLTRRLRIEPMTARLGAIAKRGAEALAVAIDADVPPEWSNAGGLRVLAHAGRAGEAGGAERALIVHRGDERVIGDLRFETASKMRNTVELGYSITQLYRRQGYAAEAAGRLIDWAFEQGGVEQIIAGCDRRNTASVRTLRKLGFWLDGARGDAFWWAIDAKMRAEANDRLI